MEIALEGPRAAVCVGVGGEGRGEGRERVGGEEEHEGVAFMGRLVICEFRKEGEE